MKLKKMTAFLAVVFILAAAILPAAASDENGVKVYVGDTIFEAGKTKIVNGLTYVPLRTFCERMGDCDVMWDPETCTATVKADGLVITAKNKDEYICANGRYLFSASPNYIDSDNRLYVPIRPLAKAFGAEVTWDEDECAAIVGAPTGPIESGDTFYNKDDVYWLSHIIYSESGIEPFLGQVAVGNVVLNRMNLPGYPQTIYGIIFDNRFGVQFAPTATGTIWLDPDEESVIAAKVCLEGFSLSKDIIFFLDPVVATNLWIVYNCTYVMSIGAHAFYSN